MLPQVDTLHTIAEVGIAITGFAGIVAAIRGGADIARKSSVVDPLGLLLGTSLATVFFCFVPEWLNAAIASPPAAWRLALGVYGTYRLAYIALILNARRRGTETSGPIWMAFVGTSVGILHLVGAAGFLTDFHYFLYLSGLLWGLVIALMNFSSLLNGRG